MNSEIQPMDIKSNLLIQATKYNDKRVVKFTLDLFDVFGKLFSPVEKGNISTVGRTINT
ncbi:MAG: hypothetical protein ACR5LB_05735 [Wolbachia sp.]